MQSVENILNANNEVRSQLAKINTDNATGYLMSEIREEEYKIEKHSLQYMLDDDEFDLRDFLLYPLYLYKEAFTKNEGETSAFDKFENILISAEKSIVATFFMATLICPILGGIGFAYHEVHKLKAKRKIKSLQKEINKRDKKLEQEKSKLDTSLCLDYQTELSLQDKQSELKEKIVETKNQIIKIKNSMEKQEPVQNNILDNNENTL